VRFGIQLGSPELVAEAVEEIAEDFSEAITCAYAKETEVAFLFWNHLAVVIDYHYDTYVMAEGIVDMLEALRDPAFTATRVFWGSSEFLAEWRLRAAGADVVVDSEWHSAHGSFEFLLNERSELTVGREFFVAEWTKLLRKLVADVAAKEVRMESTAVFDRARALAGTGGAATR
jgi:hypothetical protein